MKSAELCTMLNDPETNLLADLFLDFLGLDRSTMSYRYLRNAVISATAFSNGMPSLYIALGELDNSDPELIATAVQNVLKGLNVPELFNDVYSTPNKLCIVMPMGMSTDDAVLFLATVFTYIRHVNYGGE